MRTTLNTDDDLLREAVRQTGVKSKTDVVDMALRALLEREARRKLKALCGKIPEPRSVGRRRP